MCRAARSSKRLRGETVDKLAMCDNPELLARRIRQATQGESGPRAVPKQPRFVHFEQPLSGAEAMEEGEEAVQGAEIDGQQERSLANTPHDRVTHTGVPPGLTPSELELTLSNSTAQRGGSGMMEEEREQYGDASAQIHALHAASSSALEPPNTTRKVLATSKDSLRKALDIAQGILGSDAEAAAVTKDIGVNPARDSADAVELPAQIAFAGANTMDSSLDPEPQSADAAAANDAKDVQGMPGQQFGGSAELNEPLPGREMDPDSSVLASTTRPNVPRKLGGNLAHLKAASSSPVMRVTHAGHTPHPSKSLMMPPDHPAGTPHESVGFTRGSRGGSRDQEGATPAATLRPFDLSTRPTPVSSTAGNLAYPSSNGAPIQDTPMTRVGHAVPSQMVPDSCVGQVCLGWNDAAWCWMVVQAYQDNAAHTCDIGMLHTVSGSAELGHIFAS